MLTSTEALWFLPFVLPICIWVAWSDLKFMKIPNKAVMAMLAVFLVVGLIVIPLSEYPWRLLQGLVVLVVGFVLNMVRMIGAGDAKFAAAMALFIPVGDAQLLMLLFASVLIAGFASHRLFRAVPALRSRCPDWKSWTSKQFPMGLALGGTMIFYLIYGVFAGT